MSRLCSSRSMLPCSWVSSVRVSRCEPNNSCWIAIGRFSCVLSNGAQDIIGAGSGVTDSGNYAGTGSSHTDLAEDLPKDWASCLQRFCHTRCTCVEYGVLYMPASNFVVFERWKRKMHEQFFLVLWCPSFASLSRVIWESRFLTTVHG